ncbi:hypothetical protein DFH28DRAFT_927371 [Melampsora americana]|nr:hypothetical protein DFH28DRAFT_927371 [Melampsora americana]
MSGGTLVGLGCMNDAQRQTTYQWPAGRQILMAKPCSNLTGFPKIPVHPADFYTGQAGTPIQTPGTLASFTPHSGIAAFQGSLGSLIPSQGFLTFPLQTISSNLIIGSQPAPVTTNMLLSKLVWLEKQFKAAFDIVNSTGQGILDRKDFKEELKGMGRIFDTAGSDGDEDSERVGLLLDDDLDKILSQVKRWKLEREQLCGDADTKFMGLGDTFEEALQKDSMMYPDTKKEDAKELIQGSSKDIISSPDDSNRGDDSYGSPNC